MYSIFGRELDKQNSFINSVLNRMGYEGPRIFSAITKYAYVCIIKGDSTEEGGGRRRKRGGKGREEEERRCRKSVRVL